MYNVKTRKTFNKSTHNRFMLLFLLCFNHQSEKTNGVCKLVCFVELSSRRHLDWESKSIQIMYSYFFFHLVLVFRMQSHQSSRKLDVIELKILNSLSFGYIWAKHTHTHMGWRYLDSQSIFIKIFEKKISSDLRMDKQKMYGFFGIVKTKIKLHYICIHGQYLSV